MHACVFTVDISNSTLPQFFTVLYAVFVYYYSCSLCCTLWLYCGHVRPVGVDACGVADARDTTRVAGVCL